MGLELGPVGFALSVAIVVLAIYIIAQYLEEVAAE